MDIDRLLPIPGIPFPQWYKLAMDWKTPVLVALIYVVTVSFVNTFRSGTRLSRVEAKNRGEAAASTGSSRWLTPFVFAHNAALCIYSAVTFVHMVRGLHRTRHHYDTLLGAMCDPEEFFWYDTLGFWGYLFYLSKFYEVVDTVIILLKGRRSSLLQTYHHAGAMLTMWVGIRYRATPIWMFVTFNSFIHSIMYMYYACTTINIHPPGKRYLTSLQIAQFLVGFSLAASYLFVPGCLRTPGQRFCTNLNLFYLAPLTYLFFDFAKKTYGRRMAKSKQQ